MSTASDFLSGDHHSCDALWAVVETCADQGDLRQTQLAFSAFDRALQRHFDFEEQALFGPLDAATGMHGVGPTAVMRSEHTQMRQVLRRMAGELESGDLNELLEHGDTLLMLIQQHNMKEEHIVYPLADAHLVATWPQLRARWPNL